ncbi:GntR family transcriptional regulator [Pigmentiphaga sp. GD03639]|jgi:DNA-binding GntR family transcriptional regulator|uniref:GntR family transcriptional regulator n=1 Tax=unclassified Pigmentiphaga TaxID=2626614 RepID=UPI000B40FEA1|nr:MULTISPECIES: GntR family transcriptional regulator [unclassified Pigmentiphaga]MDH2236065.1 GntR family transcriptional regulator [Pigmentiphaga sp. GD03639]OVZ58111.1 hypothetical protein CDO46_26695 [Pigmentiphaga sp. NML030171]
MPAGRHPKTQPGDSPRYRQILDALLARIEHGIYPVGGHVPTEGELCREFEASRYTIRAALARLVEHGMVERRPGAGTVVLASRSRRAYQQSIASLSDLFQYALDTHVEIRASTLVTLDAATAAMLGAREGDRWLQVDSVRWTERGGTPICCTSSFLPERLAWIGPELPGCVGPFYAHIEARAGEPIVRATQEIRAEPMPAHLRPLLDERADAIALCLIRHYFSAVGSVICSFNWHPAASFSYRMEIERRG